MNKGYRAEMREIHRESRWTIWKFSLLFLGVAVAATVVGFGLRSAGLIGGTAVEREVFEQSYQRSAAMAARIATDEAVLAEIQHQLRRPELSAATRNNLEAQASSARVRIATARSIK